MSNNTSFKGTSGFDAANQKVINLADATNPQDALNLRTFDAKNTVPTYNAAKSYPIDFVVEYIGQLWKCIGVTTGAFDKTKWTAIKGTENWIRITGTYTAVPMDSLLVDTGSIPISITLPATPKSGDYVRILDAGNGDVNNITLIRNGSTIAGVAANFVLNESAVDVTLVYLNATWVLNIDRVNRVKFLSSAATVESNLVYSMTVAASYTVTLPQTPKSGDWVTLVDRAGAVGTYPITVAGGVKQIDGGSTFTFNQKKAAWQFIYNGSQWVSFQLTGNNLTADNNLSDLVNAATARNNLGLGSAATQVMGTGAAQIRTNAQNDAIYQVLDQTLTAIAALATAADKITYSTGIDTFAQADFPAQARSFLAATTQALQRTSLGLGSGATATVGTAAGNVMPVGAFGLGGDTPVGDVDLNNYRAGGFFLTPVSGLSNLPSGWAQGRHSVFVAGSSASYVSQIIIPVGADVGSASKIAFRWSTAPGAWSTWAELGVATGLGTAASRNVGLAATNVMEVGAFGWGTNDIPGPVVIDLDTLNTVGITYIASGSTNIPVAESGFLFVSGSDASNVRAIQTFRSVFSARIFERRQFTTWSAWVEVLHSGNTGTAAYANIGTATGNVLAVGAGGWLAGGGIGGSLVDVSTLTTTQLLWMQPTAANLPVAAYGTLFHMQAGDALYATQRFYTITGTEWVRYKASGTWGAWSQVLSLAQQFPAWTNVTYSDGCVDFEALSDSVSYRLEGKRVWMRGMAKCPTAPGTVNLATLPVGYRPIKKKSLPILLGNQVGVYVVVNTAGLIQITGYTTANVAIPFDTVSFEID